MCADLIPVKISVDPRSPGTMIPEQFVGLSFETAQLLPDANGQHYFDTNRTELVAVFKTMGIKHVRVGGGSVDSTKPAIPSEADIKAFFEFAQAAGVKVIYSVRLHDGDPQSAAKIAGFIHQNFPEVLDCFAIGNEPTGYYKDPTVYRSKWMAIRDAIVAVVPEAKFCGPDDNPKSAVFTNAAQNFPSAGMVMLTMHSYPGGSSFKNPSMATPVDKLIRMDSVPAREKLLSTAIQAEYEKAHKVAANAAAGTALTYRLDESNTFWYGGLQGASDSYAAALWGIDYLYWWAAHGAQGVNFHTGERVGGSDHVVPCRYASFLRSDQGYNVKPLGYGLKMFNLGAVGELIPVIVPTTVSNLVAHATRAEDDSIAVTLINKAHGAEATELPVEIVLDTQSSFSDARVIFLTAPANAIAATNGLTIGGAPIADDGSWRGKWTSLLVGKGTNAITLIMPPASAAVMKLKLK